MIRLPFWSGAGRRKTSASPPGGGPPLPPHIGDYVIHSEARIFWNFRPEIVQRPSLRHARKQDFYHSEARKTSASAPGGGPPFPPSLRSVRSNGSIISNGSNRSNRSKAIRFRAGQRGRPVLPAGARLAPTWRAGGLLPGKGTREEFRRGAQRAGADGAPPHSYHRRWVI